MMFLSELVNNLLDYLYANPHLRRVLRRQSYCCKQCGRKFEHGDLIVLVIPRDALSRTGDLDGAFCSDECETKFLIGHRQQLEQLIRQRVNLVTNRRM